MRHDFLVVEGYFPLSPKIVLSQVLGNKRWSFTRLCKVRVHRMMSSYTPHSEGPQVLKNLEH